MHVQNRNAMVVFDFVIGALAGISTWIQFINFGYDAWRLLSTWVALVATIYYVVDAIVMYFAKRRTIGSEICPILQGGLIISSITLLLSYIICYTMGSYVPVTSSNAMLIEFLLPILMILSWVIFSTKGKWRVYDPIYWLAFPGTYAALIVLSGEFMSRTSRMIYPYEFLNYPAIGVDTMLWWLAILATLILVVGYIFWILDFALSGKLAKHIVMPKIKTIVVEEEIDEEATMPLVEKNIEHRPQPKAQSKTQNKPQKRPDAKANSQLSEKLDSKPEEKPVKLVTTGARNLPKTSMKQPNSVKSQKTNNSSSRSTNKPVKTQSTPVAPPVRILEKIELSETKKPTELQSADKKSSDTKPLDAKQPGPKLLDTKQPGPKLLDTKQPKPASKPTNIPETTKAKTITKLNAKLAEKTSSEPKAKPETKPYIKPSQKPESQTSPKIEPKPETESDQKPSRT